MMYYEAIDTIGLELEVENVPNTREITSKINNLGFQVMQDASIQSHLPTFNGIPTYSTSDRLTSLLGIQSNDYGIEVVSEPVNPSTTQFQKRLDSLCALLSPLEGEASLSDRASMHVHVCVGKNLNLHQLKSIVRWATRLESFFYRYGSFGREFRGYKYDYTYCRPITSKGPHVITDVNDREVQVFNTLDLVSATSIEDFWFRYCDVLNTTGMKYHPVRYNWINLFSMFKHGTLEFRVFNLNLDPYTIRSTIHLCQAVAHTMLTTSYKKLKELEINPINNLVSPNETQSLEAINYILDNYPMGYPSYRDIIELNFNRSVYPEYSDEYVWSHVFQKRGGMFFSRRGERDYVPPIVSGKIKKPNFIDIHDARSRVKNVPTKFNQYLNK